jgi:hypothetical protein
VATGRDGHRAGEARQQRHAVQSRASHRCPPPRPALLPAELDVAQAALHWAAPDPASRGLELPTLLAAARLPPRRLLAQAGQLGWTELPPGAAAALRPALEAACEALAARQRPAQGAEAQGGAAAAAGSGGAAAAGVAVYRPRQSTPTALLVAGGLDEGWRPLK